METQTRPRSIGRYVILGQIASGGMASVHFGRLVAHGGFARQVAIKRLHAHLAAEPAFAAMLLDEARLVGRIAHANVVPTLDVVVDDLTVCLVMEYVRGLALSQLFKIIWARGQRVPTRIAVGIVIGVLQGLHAAHEATDERGTPMEIIHRDVTPHNILVSVDGVARLVDFGIAKAAVRLQATPHGLIKGKFSYMSPEQMLGVPLTRRTDLYSAGVVLWEALTGQRLFQADHDATVLLQVVAGTVEPPSHFAPSLPRSLDEAVLRATARSAAGRPATAREMAMELERCGPVASASEIAHWLMAVGSEALAERARRIAELERGAEAFLADTEQAATRVYAGATPASSMRVPVAGAGVARSSAARPRRRSRVVTASLAATGLVVAALAVGLVLAARTPRSPAPGALTSVTAAPSGQPAMASATSAAAPGPAPSSAVAVPSAAPAKTSHAGASAQPHAKTCAPYSVDAAGHLRFNAECL